MTSAAADAADNAAGLVGTSLMAIWFEEDMLRLLRCLGAREACALPSLNQAFARRLSTPVAELRKVEADPEQEGGNLQVLEMQEALADLEKLLAEAQRRAGGVSPVGLLAASDELTALEAALHTEMRYVHGPDWEMKPGKLISKKGTWLKHTTRFSWEIAPKDKLYLPEGVALPVLQIGRVTNTEELKLHEWSSQHLRVWLKPAIVRTLENRRDVWFIYWPHFEGEGNVIAAAVDTWLKRSTQMSGELQPFELVYVPKGMVIHLTRTPEIVTEEWEKQRHVHVHRHRKVILASPPLTMRRDKYDIFVGQPKDKIRTRVS